MYASARSLQPCRHGLGKGSPEFTWANFALPVEVSVGQLCSAQMVGIPEVEIATSRLVSFRSRHDASNAGQESVGFSQFPRSGPLGREYFRAYPSTDRDLGSIAMDHRALRHHSFTSSSGKEQSAIQQ